MQLRNLNELANQSRTKYQQNFVNADFELHDEFKDKYRVALGDDLKIKFLQYSAEITTSKGNTVYLPNQWFFVAAYMADYVRELIKYKTILFRIFESEKIETSRKKKWKELIATLAKKEQGIDDDLLDAIDEVLNGDKTDIELMCKFLTDYDWWYGSKTIDRGDFYNSPVLSLLGVVAVTQSYIAEIAELYASNSELMEELDRLIDDKVISSNPGASVISVNDKPVTGGTNLIVYGAPGTGKSYYLEKRNYIKRENIVHITFHPEYTYHDFIGTYKPVPVYRQENGSISDIPNGEPLIDYKFTPGPFTNILSMAYENPTEMHMLLIEEINRANAPAVFGDLFQLLDRDDNGESEYKIKGDKHLLDYLNKSEIYIPSNLHIFATMNSADQGVFVLDSAFKRRWNFKYMPIRFDESVKHKDELVKYAGTSLTWSEFVLAINSTLGKLNINEDKHIGPYFLKNGEPSNSETIASKLLIYLWDDVVRYNRKEFFIPVGTFAELVQKYLNGENIIPSIKLSIQQNNDTLVEG